MPAVSVIVPTYNHGRFLRTAIESVLNQTYRDLELIIVDDGSTDDTPQIVKRFQGPILYHRKAHEERAIARNTGIQMAKGQYIALIDSDDVWKPNRLERGVRLLENRTDVGLVHGEVEMIDSSGRLLLDETRRIQKLYERERRGGSTYEELLKSYALFSSTVLFRKNSFDRVGFYNQKFPPREDYDWYLRFALSGKIHILESPPVASYRIQSKSESYRNGHSKMAKLYINILESQLSEIEKRLTGSRFREASSRVMTKLAEFHAALGEREKVRTRLAEAIRLDPKVAFDLRVAKRFISSFFSGHKI